MYNGTELAWWSPRLRITSEIDGAHDFIVELLSIVNLFINKFCAQLEKSSIFGIVIKLLARVAEKEQTIYGSTDRIEFVI